MKERPILFGGLMVRAILGGQKTQTRRIVKPQPPFGCSYEINGAQNAALCRSIERPEVWVCPTPRSSDHRLPCPYGQPGDWLWVQEEHHIKLRDARSVSVSYLADGLLVPEVTIGQREHALFTARKRPNATTRARFMWRCLSRITLEVTAVRVERLKSISEADASAEGTPAVRTKGEMQSDRTIKPLTISALTLYRDLWSHINGPGSWDANPWVWVIEFRRVTS